MHKKKFLTIFRTLVQFILFILLPGLYASAFFGLKLIYQGLIEHNFNLSQSFPLLISVISIVPLTLLFGRFFCGWMCAFGTLGDMLYYLSRKVFKIKYRINEGTDAVLKYVKYVVFVLIYIVVWSIQAIDISCLSPWDAFGSLLTFTSIPNFTYVITEITVGLVLLLAIMIGSLFIERFFCRYLCPLGAVFAIISHLKFIKIKKPSKDCGPCKACTRQCSMGIPLYQMDTVDSGECISCMNCVSACPRENVNVAIVTTVTNPALAGALAVTAMAGVYYISTFATDAAAATQVTAFSSTATAVENSSIYADGTYSGSATGFRGATTTVSVTIEEDIITNIEAVSYGDDAPYFNCAFNTIVNQIISTQSAEVDAVSGATFSSNGIMDAVANALDSSRQALSSNTSTVDSDIDTAISSSPTASPTTIVEAPTDVASTTPTTDSSNSSKTTSVADSTSSSDTTITSSSGTTKKSTPTPAPTKIPSSSSTGNTNTDSSTTTDTKATVTPSPTPTTATSNTSIYNNGVYEGSANGFRRGITTVSVTIKDDAITNIQIVSNGDDAPYFNRAYKTVISDILASQSTNVDAVSGATYSSMGIMNAVEDALSSAKIG